MTSEITLFHSGPFSQWYASPFTVDDVAYANAEQFMMADKARTFGDFSTLAKIMATKSPKTIKALGRAVRPFDSGIWDRRKFATVVRGTLAKFSDPRNAALKAALLATGDSILAEASPYDTIWGIGLGEDHPNARVPSRWRGTNYLGIALMDVRRQLKDAPVDTK